MVGHIYVGLRCSHHRRLRKKKVPIPHLNPSNLTDIVSSKIYDKRDDCSGSLLSHLLCYIIFCVVLNIHDRQCVCVYVFMCVMIEEISILVLTFHTLRVVSRYISVDFLMKYQITINI